MSARARQDERTDGVQRVRRGIREPEPERAPAQRQQQAFDQELTDQPRPRRANRQTNGDLPLAHRGARQQQVREVRARDQEDQPDRSEEYEQGSADVAATSASRSDITSTVVPGLRDCSTSIAPATALNSAAA